MGRIFLLLAIFCTIPALTWAQSGTDMETHPEPLVKKTNHYQPVSLEYPELKQKLTLMSMSNPDAAFHKTFLIDENGKAISSGFAPAQNYTPAGKFILTGNGYQNNPRDSFNPYGASDAGDALLTGAINYFIGSFKKKK